MNTVPLVPILEKNKRAALGPSARLWSALARWGARPTRADLLAAGGAGSALLAASYAPTFFGNIQVVDNVNNAAAALPEAVDSASQAFKQVGGAASQVGAAVPELLEEVGKLEPAMASMRKSMDRHFKYVPLAAGGFSGGLLGSRIADLTEGKTEAQSRKRRAVGQLLGAATGAAGAHFLAQALNKPKA